MRIGLLGGTFDPPHEGHLKLASAAFDQLNLDKVVFVPAARNPLKGEAEAPPAERLAAVRRAVGGDPRFEVSACEVRRKGLSFTVDTLKYFKRKHGDSAVLYFLTGADTAGDLARWRAFGEITRLCRFVVGSRPGWKAARLPEGILSMPFDALDVSSTRLRRAVRKRRKKS